MFLFLLPLHKTSLQYCFCSDISFLSIHLPPTTYKYLILPMIPERVILFPLHQLRDCDIIICGDSAVNRLTVGLRRETLKLSSSAIKSFHFGGG